MKNKIDENKNITANSKQIALLKQNFPNCFDKNGKFLPDKLVEIVQSDEIDISKEGYSLNWLGKSYARLMANLNTETLISANAEHNSEDDNANSQNVLFQGDNLDVLKHLKSAYREQVKMIYIDPPYNTGGDGFVYEDDRKFSVEELSHLAGIDEDEARRVLEFTQSKSNSHSAWLTFMYPRLYIAKELLSDDGAIFISIDDNEHSQLKLLCDEVFGEENFINEFVWVKNSSGKTVANEFPTNIDYILFYGKSNLCKLKEVYKPLAQSTIKMYNKDDGDGRGKYRFYPMQKTKSPGPETTYDYEDNHGKLWACPQKGWRMNKSKLKDLENDNRLCLEGNKLQEKAYWNERTNEGKVADTLWNDISENHIGTAEVKKLFGQEIFDNPKPIQLINRCLSIMTDVDDTVLDFFAGSGTTAHAVMQLNAEEKDGKRKFITVQLDEPTDPKSEAKKAGYKSVYDITKERIVRASKKIQTDYPNATCDFGFKEFKTVPVFEGYLDDADTPEQLIIFDGNTLSEEQRKQLLLTWQVDDGLPLTLDLIPIQFGKYTAYQGAHILYFIEPELVLDNIIEMLKKLDTDDAFKPQKIVVFEYSLSSKAKREITEAIKGYLNKKDIELHLEVRF